MQTSDFTLPYTGKAVASDGKFTKCAIYTDKYGNRELWVMCEMYTGGSYLVHFDTIYSYEHMRDFSKHLG